MQTNDLNAARKRLRIQQGVITLASLAMIVFVIGWLISTALTGKKHGLNIKLPAFSKDSSSSQLDSAADASSSEEEAVTPVESAADSSEDDSLAEGETVYEGAALKDDFSDACFIGDSRTVGLETNSGKAKGTFFASTGLNVSSAQTETVCTLSNGNYGTVIDGLGERKFHRIFVMFGINELGWPYPDVFVDSYAELLQQIKTAQPDAEIYVESVLPVSVYATETDMVFTNENIDEFNKYVEEAAHKAGVNYLEVNSYFKDETGMLPEEAATDGIHFVRDYYLKWIDLLAYLVPQKEPMVIENKTSTPASAPAADSSEENAGGETGYDDGYTDYGYDNGEDGGEGYTDYGYNDGYTDYNYGY